MAEDVQTVWNALRGIIRDGYKFSTIKEIAGAAGLPIHKLAHLQQGRLPNPGASKSQLLDGVDGLILESSKPDKYIRHFVSEMLALKPNIHQEVEQCIQRFGWTISDGPLCLSGLQVEAVAIGVSQEVRDLLDKCYSRYQQGDYSGAMTSVCGALDILTSHIYYEHNLGKPYDDSYQQRVVKAFRAFEASHKVRLLSGKIEAAEIDTIWHNYRQAINGASYIVGSLRRNASDAHGVPDCTPEVLRHAIDCSTFIIRSITAVME